MRTLVTGGNRYIGVELVRELARRGHEVTVINSHESPLPDGVRRIHCDRTVPGALSAALSDYRNAFDVIFDHTAYVPEDMEPLIDLFGGRVEHYVFTSSQAVYRRSLVQPLREDSARLSPDEEGGNFALKYGRGKVQCENRLMQLWQRDGLPATILRVGHSFGPRSPLASRDPSFFARIESNRPILIPGDGHAALSLVHVRDVAKLMVALIGNDRVLGQAYNATGAEQASIAGLMILIGRAMGRPVEIVNVPMEIARTLNPPLLHWYESLNGSAMMSIDKALRDIDWAPEFGLESGFRDSYQWYVAEGRGRYDIDFSRDDELVKRLAMQKRMTADMGVC